MYNFKEEKHLTSKTGIQIRHHQQDIDIFINLVQKKSAQRAKNEEIYEKVQNLTKTEEYGPTLDLKRIIKLAETLRYRFQMFINSCGIDQNLLLQENQVTIKKKSG